MSSSPVHRGAISSPPIREENNNHYLSKIIRVALAVIGTIASYALLPPTGATIASFILIAATIFSFFKSRPSIAPSSGTSSPTVIVTPSSLAPTTTVFVPVPAPRRVFVPTPPPRWHGIFTSFVPASWGFSQPATRIPVGSGAVTPPSFFRNADITVDQWQIMGSPSHSSWTTMGSPSFDVWQARLDADLTERSRRAVRTPTSSTATRIPVETGELTPSSRPTELPMSPTLRSSSPLTPSFSSPSFSTSLSSETPRRDSVRVSESSTIPPLPVGTRIPAGNRRQ